MLSKMIKLGTAAGVMVGFYGLCIYFDRKRKCDPIYDSISDRQNRSLDEKLETLKTPLIEANEETIIKLCTDHLSLAQKYLEMDDSDSGVEHLCIAILLNSDIKQFIKQLELPPHILGSLKDTLPIVAKKMKEKYPFETEDH